MREDQHDIPDFGCFILEQDEAVPFCSSSQKSLVSPDPMTFLVHISRISMSGLVRERAVTRKHILHGQERMAAAEYMYDAATNNGILGHNSCNLLMFAVCIPYSIEDFRNTIAILERSTMPPKR